MIHLKEITEENLVPVLKLKVHENQTDQVAPNSVSIAQGHYSDIAWFRAIYSDETPVGFVMLSIDNEKQEYWVWRYMIDKAHQGKGYGKEAMEKIIEFLKEHHNVSTVNLSYVPKEEGGADHFYRKIGFVDTGEEDEGELIMAYTIK